VRGIFRLFARSPFEPLVRHTAEVQETVELLRPLFEAFVAGETARLEELYEEISRREHEADGTKNEVREHLPTSVLLPVNRGDILSYVKEQDAIADSVEDLGVILTMRKIVIVPELHEKLLALVDKVLETTEVLFETARELTNLQAASFTGPEVERVFGRVAELHQREREADELQAAFSKAVFEYEDRIDPISVFLLMHMAEVLGDVADHAENTGDTLRLMLARS
jgi:predicted phosphate transport protein (TIGR00153 family)